MVRNYKRKVNGTRRQAYTPETLPKAALAIKKDGLSVRKVSYQFKIPRSTLQDHLKNFDVFNIDRVQMGPLDRKTAVSETEEKVLVDLIKI